MGILIVTVGLPTDSAARCNSHGGGPRWCPHGRKARTAMSIDTSDITVVEDVWGSPFDALTSRWAVRREPTAWSDPQRLHAAATTTRALVVRNRAQITRELLAAAPQLQVVTRAGVGLDNIDLTAADDLGIVVVAALGANAVSVAEHALGLAVALARHIVPLDAQTRSGGWQRMAGRELAGGTWGLLSAGATARATGRVATAIGMRVVAYDPYLPADDPQLCQCGIQLLPLEQVLCTADVLSIHLPATEKTRGFVNADLLAQVKPGALLVNVGRGEVVDEGALADALQSGRLGGAGLDVRATEPPVLDRLEGLPNVVLTPHVAGITAQSQHRIAETLAEDLAQILNGRAAANAVGRHTSPHRTGAVVS